MTKGRVLVSGATGFVGKYLLERSNDKFQFIPLSLRGTNIDSIDFTSVRSVIHLAGIAHQTGNIREEEFDQVNHQLTRSFAAAAKNHGVEHFVFMSSIKVYGLNTSDHAIDLNTNCTPNDAYGESKLKAEIALKALNDDSFRVCSIRTPIVYGPRIKGNIRSLINLLERLPVVPFGGIDNRRSMISLSNLAEYIDHILDTKYAGIVLPTDPGSYSTTELVEKLNMHLSKPSKILSMPKFFWQTVKALKPAIYERLIGSLEVDKSESDRLLAFSPSESFEKGVTNMMRWYNQEQKS